MTRDAIRVSFDSQTLCVAARIKKREDIDRLVGILLANKPLIAQAPAILAEIERLSPTVNRGAPVL